MDEFYKFIGMTTVAIVAGLLSRYLYDAITAKKHSKKVATNHFFQITTTI